MVLGKIIIVYLLLILFIMTVISHFSYLTLDNLYYVYRLPEEIVLYLSCILALSLEFRKGAATVNSFIAPILTSNHFVVHQGWWLMRQLTV